VGSNSLLDGAGIGIGSANIRKTLTYASTPSDSLKSSENFDLGNGKVYKINGTEVLSSSTLGSAVSNSSLTSVGTLEKVQVSGISTLGTVKISSGIITSSTPSGIVTYYGDGSKLTGIGTASSAQSVILDENTTTVSASVVFSQTPTSNPTANLNSNPNLIFNAASTRLGIGSTVPTVALDVIGSAKFTGNVDVDGTFNGTLTGTSDSSNTLIGGDQGSIVYQSGTDLTSFLPADDAGKVLITQGPGQNPIWGVASNVSGFLSGLTIFDEVTQVGNAKSFTTLKFVGSNINIIGSSLVGIATITVSDNLVGTSLSISGPVSGISTIGFFEFSKETSSIGVVTATYGTTIKYYGDGSNLSGTVPNTIQNIDNNGTYYPLLSQSTSGTISSISVSSNSIVFNPGLNYLGIGSLLPKANLDVLGDANISGIITAQNHFSGSLVGIATTARNLLGGSGGSIPYQSSANTTAFISYGQEGYILSSNGENNPPSWVSAPPSNAISGISVYDEGTLTPAGGSVSRLNFVGDNITATSSGVGATITFSSNIVGTSLSIGYVNISSGIITSNTPSGIVTYYGDGSNLIGVTPGGVNVYETTNNSTYYVGILSTTSGISSGINIASSLLTFNPSTGNMVVGGTVTANSDEKLKTNIKTITNALEKVLSLRGVEYDRVDTGEHQIGVIAQEVEKIIPEVVYPKGNYPDYETKSVAYSNLIGIFIEAFKDLKSEIEELKKQIAQN
jgi:alkylated DNA nucleotide flippase Atl1